MDSTPKLTEDRRESTTSFTNLVTISPQASEVMADDSETTSQRAADKAAWTADLLNPRFYVATGAEFLGTLVLVLVSCGAVSPWTPENPSNVRISLTFAFSVATIVWNIGEVSGGHINPAVTVAFLLTRRITLIRALAYLIAQCLGAIAGAGILSYLAPDHLSWERLGTPVPGVGVTGVRAMLVEMCITFVLVWTVYATNDKDRSDHSGSGALAIGFAIGMCHLWAVPYTGAGMNPARVLGPAVVSHTWKSHWAYWAGPILGAVIAGFLYDFIMAMNATLAKLRAFLTSSHYNPDGDYTPKAVSFKL